LLDWRSIVTAMSTSVRGFRIGCASSSTASYSTTLELAKLRGRPDGVPAASSPLLGPTHLAIDPEGNLLIYESGELLFRRVSVGTGTITTYGGDLWFRTPADDMAAQRCVSTILSGFASDVDGSLILSSGYALCRLTADGVTRAIAGSRLPGFAGDGGPATDASISSPSGILVNADGSILFADSGNHRIRKLTPAAPTHSVRHRVRSTSAPVRSTY
jgi:hypothetical protein